MNDQQIIALFFDRSEQAILELSGKYGSWVRRVASNILHNAQDVEECSNDTYYQVWNQIPPKQPKYLGAFTCAGKSHRRRCGLGRDSRQDPDQHAPG